MQKQLQCFILWENSRYLEKEIIENIRKECTIIKIYEIDWGKFFAQNLKRFYGKNVLRSHKKEKECGTGKFLFIPVFDKQPFMEDGKNSHMWIMKNKFRDMTKDKGRFLVHASDCETEADTNMRFILGIGTHDFLKINQELTDNINYIPIFGMIAQNGWRNKKQLVDFIKTLPQTEIISERELKIRTADPYLLLRLLNAKKPFIQFSRNTYKLKIGNKSQKIEIFNK